MIRSVSSLKSLRSAPFPFLPCDHRAIRVYASATRCFSHSTQNVDGVGKALSRRHSMYRSFALRMLSEYISSSFIGSSKA